MIKWRFSNHLVIYFKEKKKIEEIHVFLKLIHEHSWNKVS